MAGTQQPRPAWFRFSSIPRAPTPTPTPSPVPPVMRPSIPVRPSFRPTQTPGQLTQPTPTPAPHATPARSAVSTPAPTAAPSRSPVAQIALVVAAPGSAVLIGPAQTAAPIGSTVVQPAPAVAPTRSPSAASAPTVAAPSSPISIGPAPTATPIRSPVVQPAPAPAVAPTRSPVAQAQTPLMPHKTTTTILSPIPSKPSERLLTESPKVNLSPRTPSSLTLPPAQVKASNKHEPIIEQRSKLVYDDKMKKMPRAHDNVIASNEKRETTKKESGMSVITLADENKGAVMQLSASRRNNYIVSYVDGDQSSGGQSNKKDKANREMGTVQSTKAAFMNSNVQGFNNSIVYNCSFRTNNPGIHLSLNTKANGGPS